MAVDLKISSFTTEFFQLIWQKLYRREVQTYHVPIQRNNDSATLQTSEFSDEIFCAVWTRMNLFRYSYHENFQRDYYIFSKSATDFYLYLEECCYKCSGNLHIFDKFLLVCSIVSIMGEICLKHENNMYQDIPPLCCSMYIDTKLKDEFYETGGWEELKRHASCYKYVLTGVELCNSDIKNAFFMYHAASRNYDEALLNAYFYQRWSKIARYWQANSNLCSKCSLYIQAFAVLMTKNVQHTSETVAVESLLQLVLAIKSFEQYVIVSNVSKKFRKLMSFEDLDYNILGSEIKNNDQKITNQMHSGESKSALTLELFQQLFGELEIKISDVDKYNYCLLCLRPLESSQKSNEDKHIGSIIMGEIKSCNLEASHKLSKSKSFQPDEDNKQILEHSIKRLSNSISRNFPIDKQSNSAPGNCELKANFIHMKDILRLFCALGNEPVKSYILSDLKSNYMNNTMNIKPPKNKKI